MHAGFVLSVFSGRQPSQKPLSNLARRASCWMRFMRLDLMQEVVRFGVCILYPSLPQEDLSLSRDR